MRHYSTQAVTNALIELRKPAEHYGSLEDLLRHEWNEGNIRGTSEKWTAFNGSLERAFAFKLALESDSVGELGMFIFESIMGCGENPISVIDIAKNLAGIPTAESMINLADDWMRYFIDEYCFSDLFDQWAEQEELERAVQRGIDNEMEREA